MADPIPGRIAVFDLLGGWLRDDPPPPGRLARLLPTSGILPGFPGRSSQARPVIALVALLRSLGQVIFINNPVSGLLLLLALLVQSLPMAAYTLIGIAAANVFARALGCEKESRRNGIFGFNGALVGSAIGAFADHGTGSSPLAWGLLVAGGACLTTLLVHTLGRRLHAATGLPPLTLPFCLVTWLALALVRASGHPSLQLVDPGPLPQAGGALQALLLALPRGFGQVFLLPGLASGLLVLAAVAAASPLAALVGLMGAAASAVAGLMAGADPNGVALGLWSYNGVLTAIAIGGTFYAPTGPSLLLALVAAAVAGLLSPGVAGLLPFGLPELSLPFILVTLATLLLVRHALPALVPVALHSILTPEEHRRRFLVARDLLGDLRGRLGAAAVGRRHSLLSAAADSALREGIETLFRQLDHDRDGSLSLVEFAAGLQARGDGGVGTTAGSSRLQQLASVLEAMDLDRDGSVDAGEFTELMLRLQRLSRGRERLMHYLLPVDADGDDRLERREIDRLFASIGQPVLSPAEARRLLGEDGASLTWEGFIDRLLLC
jgi:urea transporter/Ca2+-binding EF-hand superfamily protein